VEAARAADEGATALVEAKEAVGGVGDADAWALAEDEGGAVARSEDSGTRGNARTARNGCPTAIGAAGGNSPEPEGAGGAEVGAIEGPVDTKGGGEAPRTAG
jgi:hypothetical protein